MHAIIFPHTSLNHFLSITFDEHSGVIGTIGLQTGILPASLITPCLSGYLISITTNSVGCRNGGWLINSLSKQNRAHPDDDVGIASEPY